MEARYCYTTLGLPYARRTKHDNPLLGFFGADKVFSNFYMVDFEFKGLKFSSSEQAYMWHKSDNPSYRQRILLTHHPMQCKAAGRTAVLPSNWDEIKFQIMFDVVLAKFSSSKYLRQCLLDTGYRYLEETNRWNDVVWGVCDGVGANHLGRILMCIRYMFQQEDTK
jgi:ribA/ribD-fused uncharacterized protein